MIIQFTMLIVFATSLLYILVYTSLFRKVRLIYLIAGLFITSTFLVPILYQSTIVMFAIDICLLAYILLIHKNRRIHHANKDIDVLTTLVQIKNAARAIPFHYYLIVAFFLLVSVAYISSDFFWNLYDIEKDIFSDTTLQNSTLQNINHNVDSYQSIIIWILIISIGLFLLKKIIKTKW